MAGWKQLTGSAGIAVVLFLFVLLFVSGLTPANYFNPGKNSMEVLWTDLVLAVIIEAFVIFAALLAVNLEFTPPMEDH